VVLADSVRNYMSKFLNDQWMIDNGYAEDTRPIDTWWADRTVAELKLSTPVSVTPTVSCSECINILKEHGYDQLPVVSSDNEIMGMVSLGNLTSQVVSGRVMPDDPVSKCIFKQFRSVSLATTLGSLSKIFDRDHFVLVITTQRCYTGPGTATTRSVVYGVVTRIDLLNYIVTNQKAKVHKALAGGVGGEKAVDDEAIAALAHVRNQLLEKLGEPKDAKVEVLSYNSQVVAGTNYFLKVSITSAKGAHVVHARVHQALTGEYTLHSFQGNKSRADPIAYF